MTSTTCPTQKFAHPHYTTYQPQAALAVYKDDGCPMPSSSSPHLAPPSANSERLLEFCAAASENSAAFPSSHQREAEGPEEEELGETEPLLQSHKVKAKGKPSPSSASAAMALSQKHEVEPVVLETTHVTTKKSGEDYQSRPVSGGGSSGNEHTGPGAPEVVGGDAEQSQKKWRWFNYLTTKQFWIVLVLGYVLIPLFFQNFHFLRERKHC